MHCATAAPGRPSNTGEEYGLIGGVISTLAAAHFYRSPSNAMGRILILDNHDDFASRQT